MTYKDLAEYIRNMDPKACLQSVTVFISGVDEYYPLDEKTPLIESSDSDVLDDGHIFLVI